MTVREDIQYNCLRRLALDRLKCLKEHIHKLARCTTESHGVRQIIEINRHWDRDDVAFRKSLQIRQIIIQCIAVPAISLLD